MRRLCTLTVLMVATTGCMVGPDYMPPELRPDVEFRNQSPSSSSLANTRWWEFFQDPALQKLIETALEENKNLQAAYWRLESARARLGFTRADLYPGFVYNGGVHISDGSDTLGAPSGRSEAYSVGDGQCSGDDSGGTGSKQSGYSGYW